ncbi:MAG: hypothetical protein K8R40_09385 [Anaerolineaceae bacterium]|nr:hypothetical protein [Anaerolineaceae bacterium]
MSENDFSGKLLMELKSLNKTHSDILATMSLIVLPEIEKRLAHIFLSSDEFTVYKLSDGINSSSDIAKIVDVSRTTIAKWWKKWEENFGIVETSGYKNPYQRKFSIVELAFLLGKLSEDKE